MSLFTHIQIIHLDSHILLWNPHTGRGLKLSHQTYNQQNWHPAIKKRCSQLYLCDIAPDLGSLILYRSRWSLLIDHTLIHPNPQHRTSGGYAYQKITLSPLQQSIWLQLNGRSTLQSIATQLQSTVSVIHQACFPLLSYTVQGLQLREEKLPTTHRAFLQLFSPPRPQNHRQEHMYDTHGGTILDTFHHEEITDATHHFDQVEITLAHALEPPHPVLKNQPFGSALAKALLKLCKKEPRIILELGAGTGALAKAWLSTHQPQRYIRMDACSALLEAQNLLVPESEGILATAPVIPLAPQSIDLFISNEVIADLSAASIRDPESVSWISKYHINLEEGQSWINLGAWKLLLSIWNVLCPQGMAYISEFGDIYEVPTEAQHLNHPEVSVHFGQLENIAQQMGFQTQLIALPKLLNMDLQQCWIAKHSFCALRAHLHSKEQILQARAWHPSTIDISEIHGIEWCPMTEPGPAPLPERIWVLLLWKPPL